MSGGRDLPVPGEDDLRLARAALRLLAGGDGGALPAPGVSDREQIEARARALWRRHLADRRRQLERRLWRIRALVVAAAVAGGAVLAWDGAGALLRGVTAGSGPDSPTLLWVLGGAAALATCCGEVYRRWVET